MTSDHVAVQMTETEWRSLLTVIDSAETGLDCDADTVEMLTALQHKIQHQV